MSTPPKDCVVRALRYTPTKRRGTQGERGWWGRSVGALRANGFSGDGPAPGSDRRPRRTLVTVRLLESEQLRPGRALAPGSTSVLVCACDKHSPPDGSTPLTRPCPGRGGTPACHPVTRCAASDRTSGTPVVCHFSVKCAIAQIGTAQNGTKWHAFSRNRPRPPSARGPDEADRHRSARTVSNNRKTLRDIRHLWNAAPPMCHIVGEVNCA